MTTQPIANREIVLFSHFEYAGCQPVSAKGCKSYIRIFPEFHPFEQLVLRAEGQVS